MDSRFTDIKPDLRQDEGHGAFIPIQPSLEEMIGFYYTYYLGSYFTKEEIQRLIEAYINEWVRYENEFHNL